MMNRHSIIPISTSHLSQRTRVNFQNRPQNSNLENSRQRNLIRIIGSGRLTLSRWKRMEGKLRESWILVFSFWQVRAVLYCIIFYASSSLLNSLLASSHPRIVAPSHPRIVTHRREKYKKANSPFATKPPHTVLRLPHTNAPTIIIAIHRNTEKERETRSIDGFLLRFAK